MQVDVLLREVRGRTGPARRITPKAMAVLQELAARTGDVVTREELLAAVWPDTLPTDDVLTQAITQLRKAVRQTGGPEDCIQTIAKTGYRLLCDVRYEPVEALEPEGTDASRGAPDVPETAPESLAPSAATPTRTPARVWAGIAAGAALIGLVAVAIIWKQSPSPVAPRRASAPSAPVAAPAYQLITSAPGGEFSPSLSPDGALVAYVATPPGAAGTAILVQPAGQSQARALTRPPLHADDAAPVWSPDGRELVYRRTWPDGRCEIRIAAASGLGERVASTCAIGDAPEYDWSPDGRTLVFGGARGGDRPARLRLLSLDDGSWRDVVYTAAPGDSDTLPRYSRDGRTIVFVRNSPTGDLWRIPAVGGRAERVTRVGLDIRGWHGLPDAGAVVLAHVVDGAWRLLRVDLASGRVADLGLDTAVQPAIARNRPLLAFVRSRPGYGLHRVRLPTSGPSSHVVEPLLPSSARDMLPAIAPDGRQLLFVSDRSGAQGLWYARLDDAASLRMLAGIVPRTRLAPSWAPDGRRALVAARSAEGRRVLVEVEPATGRRTVLPVPVADPVQGLYGPDAGELLVLASDRDGRQSLVRFDRRSRPWRRLATLADVSRAEVDRDRVVLTRPGRSGLWAVDLSLDPTRLRPIDSERPDPAQYRMWDITADGRVGTVSQTQDCAVLLRIAAPGQAARPRCLDTRQRAAVNGYTLAASGNEAFLALVTSEEADIAVLPLSPTAAP